jgi:hypothetical protein
VDLMKKIKNAYKALVMKPPRKLHLKDWDEVTTLR